MTTALFKIPPMSGIFPTIVECPPDALKSKSWQARGIGVYELEDVLVDADLFRRLRVRGEARGEARGADGISDLIVALGLVSGPPFDQLRSDGYEWLTEGARLDHHLVCGIADVAHVVTTHALAVGDIKRARAAAEIAQVAAPTRRSPGWTSSRSGRPRGTSRKRKTTCATRSATGPTTTAHQRTCLSGRRPSCATGNGSPAPVERRTRSPAAVTHTQVDTAIVTLSATLAGYAAILELIRYPQY